MQRRDGVGIHTMSVVRTQFNRAGESINIFLVGIGDTGLRLLFAHALIGLVIVAIGISVEDPYPFDPENEPSGSKKGFNDAGPSYYAKISGRELGSHAGRYHIDSSFREEFSNFRSVDLPMNEVDFIEHAGDLMEVGTENLWKLKSLVIDGESISFQTTSQDEESYVFAGRIRPTSKCSLETIRFEGQLTKIKDNVVVATMNAEFHQVCGC